MLSSKPIEKYANSAPAPAPAPAPAAPATREPMLDHPIANSGTPLYYTSC
jgi:hypothetical protein